MFQDTQEGKTHYENDGCGEPAHNKSPITKAHLEGVKNFNTAFLTNADGNIMAAYTPEMFVHFLTTYGINLLKAAKEAGFGEINDSNRGGDSKERMIYQDAWNTSRSSFISAIDEGIEGIKKGGL